MTEAIAWKGRQRLLLTRQAWAIAVFFCLAIFLGLLGQSRVLTLVYPVGALALGAYFIRRSPGHYLALLLWLFFLSPFIRRLSDYTGGWSSVNLVSLAPYLPPLLTVPVALRQILWPRHSVHVALLAVMLAIGYALIIGCLRQGVAAASYEAITWLLPVCVALYIEAHQRSSAVFGKIVLSAAIWGTLAMGVYGLVQYLVLPPWDAYWMINSQMNSIGSPVPLEVRVFGTMNSPTPFAMTLAALMTIFLPEATALTSLVIVAGLCSLLLSLVREAWLQFSIALLMMLALMGWRQPRVLVAFAFLCCAAIALAFSSTVSVPILTRMESLLEIQNDESYEDRQLFYQTFAPIAFTQVIGRGLGEVGVATKLSDDDDHLDFDSGLMEIPYELGWLGGILYAGGVAFVLARCARCVRHDAGVLYTAFSIVPLSLAPMLIFSNIFSGPVGMMFWMFAGLALVKVPDRAAQPAARSSPPGQAVVLPMRGRVYQLRRERASYPAQGQKQTRGS